MSSKFLAVVEALCGLVLLLMFTLFILALFSLFTGCVVLPRIDPPPPNAPVELGTHSCAVYRHGQPECSCARTGGLGAVTAAHCALGEPSEYQVGSRAVVAIARLDERDVAYLELDGDGDGLSPARSGMLNTGRWMLGFGCAWADFRVPASARELEPMRYAKEWDAWEYRGRVCAGDSGAGVWSDEGRLVGVVTGKGKNQAVYVEGFQ